MSRFKPMKSIWKWKRQLERVKERSFYTCCRFWSHNSSPFFYEYRAVKKGRGPLRFAALQLIMRLAWLTQVFFPNTSRFFYVSSFVAFLVLVLKPYKFALTVHLGFLCSKIRKVMKRKKTLERGLCIPLSRNVIFRLNITKMGTMCRWWQATGSFFDTLPLLKQVVSMLKWVVFSA